MKPFVFIVVLSVCFISCSQGSEIMEEYVEQEEACVSTRHNIKPETSDMGNLISIEIGTIKTKGYIIEFDNSVLDMETEIVYSNVTITPLDTYESAYYPVYFRYNANEDYYINDFYLDRELTVPAFRPITFGDANVDDYEN